MGLMYLQIDSFDWFETLHAKSDSMWQKESHPSLLSRLPSSHSSRFFYVIPSPQIFFELWLFVWSTVEFEFSLGEIGVLGSVGVVGVLGSVGVSGVVGVLGGMTIGISHL